MDQVHVVRHKVLVEGRPQRQVARELGISRVTVRKYLDQAAPARQETQPRRAAGLGGGGAADRGAAGRVAAVDGRQAAADGHAAASAAARRGPSRRRDAGEGGGGGVEAAAARGLRPADVSRRAIWRRSTSSRCWSTSPASGGRRGCFCCG